MVDIRHSGNGQDEHPDRLLTVASGHASGYRESDKEGHVHLETERDLLGVNYGKLLRIGL